MARIKQSLKTGLSFGLTSGVVTTLGLITGLHSGTHSKAVIIGGILVIAVADALSDALGIHMSEEFNTNIKRVPREVWESTVSTFLSKLVFALTFLAPILSFALPTAIIISVLWGLFLIGFFSFYIAKQQGNPPYKIVLEHLVVTILVVVVTHCIGDWAATLA